MHKQIFQLKNNVACYFTDWTTTSMVGYLFLDTMVKPIQYLNSIGVCQGFRLNEARGLFSTTFEASIIFSGSWGSSKNCKV